MRGAKYHAVPGVIVDVANNVGGSSVLSTAFCCGGPSTVVCCGGSSVLSTAVCCAGTSTIVCCGGSEPSSRPPTIVCCRWSTNTVGAVFTMSEPESLLPVLGTVAGEIAVIVRASFETEVIFVAQTSTFTMLGGSADVEGEVVVVVFVDGDGVVGDGGGSGGTSFAVLSFFTSAPKYSK